MTREDMMKTTAALVAFTTVLAGSAAQAVDISPGDYAWVGDGRNLFLLYGQHLEAGSFTLDGTGAIPNSDLAVSAMVLRGVHYTELGGSRFSFQAFIPVGKIDTARVGGATLGTSDGIGDLTLGATWYPLASDSPTGTTLGLTAFLIAPTGAYTFGDASLGSGTWTFAPQIGVIQGLGNGFFFDGALDVALQQDHTENGVKIARDPTVQVQTYLRYQQSATTAFSIGYSGMFGGDLDLNGSYSGQKNRVDQIRVFAQHFTSQSTQMQLMLAKDIHVEGGFKSDYVAQVRFLKVF